MFDGESLPGTIDDNSALINGDPQGILGQEDFQTFFELRCLSLRYENCPKFLLYVYLWTDFS
jgi:hypothetical protein